MSTIGELLASRAGRRGIRYDLAAMTVAVDRLGLTALNQLPIIHVAGTNGKGSVSTGVADELKKNGAKVGLFTSPHLMRYTERITINGQEISAQKLQQIFNQIESKTADLSLTEFELLTLMAAAYFIEESVDYVVLETGLGGRLDATNVFQPMVTAITKIGLDHAEYLGGTIAEIAREKLGIVKPNTPLFMLAQGEMIQSLAQSVCENQQAPFHWVSPLKDAGTSNQNENGALITAILDNLGIPISGPPFKTPWGRFDARVINGERILVDAAHNPLGIQTLVASISQQWPSMKVRFLVGILKAKEWETMITTIRSLSSDLWICQFDSSAISVASVADLVDAQSFSLGEALPILPNGLTIMTGSIYFLGALKQQYVELNSET